MTPSHRWVSPRLGRAVAKGRATASRKRCDGQLRHVATRWTSVSAASALLPHRTSFLGASHETLSRTRCSERPGARASPSIRRCSASSPAVVKPDYAKWMLEDPRINFAISQPRTSAGVNHLGMQADDDAELEAIHANLQKADTTVVAGKGRALLLREVRQVLGNRSAGNRLGKLPLAGLHTVVREAEDRACCSEQARRVAAMVQRRIVLLRADSRGRKSRSCKASAAALPHSRGRAPLQRAVSLHAQFGAQHHGRSDHQLRRSRKVQGIFGREPSCDGAESLRAGDAATAAFPDRRSLQQELGRIRQARSAGHGFCPHRMRQRGRRSLSGLAGPADHGSLGRRGPVAISRAATKQRVGNSRGSPTCSSAASSCSPACRSTSSTV